MKITLLIQTAIFLYGALLSPFDVWAEAFEYPLYTYYSTDNKYQNDSAQQQERLRNYTYRSRLADIRKTHNFSFSVDAELALKFKNRRKISKFEELRIRTANKSVDHKNIDTLSIFQDQRHLVELPNVKGYDSLLLYYKDLSLLNACRPQMHIEFQVGPTNKDAHQSSIETYTGIYKSISNIPILPEIAKNKNLSYFVKKHFNDQGKYEWWMTQKENLTVFQRAETIKLFGKSRLVIWSKNEIQQVNIVATIKGKGQHLLEYTDIKNKILNGRNIISIDLHEKLEAINPNLLTDGYNLMPVIEGHNEAVNKLSADGGAAAVEINEIIINVIGTSESQSDIQVEISTDSQFRPKFSEFTKVSVPAEYHQLRESYQVLEIPLQAIRKFRDIQQTTAQFYGISDSNFNLPCQFDALKAVLVNYETYKFPIIAANNWIDETNDFLDIIQFEDAREFNNTRPIYRVESLVVSDTQERGSAAIDGPTGTKYPLLNGSLYAKGFKINKVNDVNSKTLHIIGEAIKAIRISSTVGISGDSNYSLLVSSSGLCGSDYFILKLYEQGGHSRILKGESNHALNITGNGNQIVSYEIEFNAPETSKPCQSFDFNFISIYQRTFTSNWSFLSDDPPVHGTKEAVISSAQSSISSLGNFGQRDHIYSLSYVGDRLSINLPADLFMLESITLRGNSIFDAEHCADVKLTFVYEQGDAISTTGSPKGGGACNYPSPSSLNGSQDRKLLYIYINHRSNKQSPQIKLRVDLSGIYKTPVLIHMKDSIIGTITGQNIHLANDESFSKNLLGNKLDPLLLKFPIEIRATNIIVEPWEVFMPSEHPYYSVKKIVLTVSDSHVFSMLQNLIDTQLVTPRSLIQLQLLAISIIILVSFLGKFNMRKLISPMVNLFRSRIAFLTNWNFSCKHCLLLSCYSIVLFLFILASFLFPSKSVALALIFSSIIIFSCLFYLRYVDQNHLSPAVGKLIEPSKLGFLLSILFINSIHFFFITLVGAEYQPAAFLLVGISSLVCFVLLWIPLGIKHQIIELGEFNIFLILMSLASILVLSYFSRNSQFGLTLFFSGACFIFLLINRLLSPMRSFYFVSSIWFIACAATLFNLKLISSVASITAYAALIAVAIRLTYDSVRKSKATTSVGIFDV